MPFTLVHPAAVLPLARTPLVPAALVAGSVAPDLPYFVSLLWIGGDYNLTLTHDWTSVLWLDPAIALVLLAAFRLLLRRPLLALLPPGIAERVGPPAGGIGWVLASVVVGAASHLAWDGLCDLAGTAWSTRLNLASDVLGAVVLVAWLAHWRRTTAPRPASSSPLAQRHAALAAIVAVPLAWGAVQAARIGSSVYDGMRTYGVVSPSYVADFTLRVFVTHTGTALGVTVAAYAVLWHAGRLVPPPRRRADRLPVP